MENPSFLKTTYTDFCASLSGSGLEAYRGEFERLFSDVPLRDRSFLDVGSGMGLSLLLAAERGALAAGLDTDPAAPGLTEANRALLFPGLPPQRVLAASALEDLPARLKAEGLPASYDIVHAWGVFHHTGGMWNAIRNAGGLVKPGGRLVFSLYNRHFSSPAWKLVKRLYCAAPAPAKRALFALSWTAIAAAIFLTTGELPPQICVHGLDFGTIVTDWLNGYPYQYASKEEVLAFASGLGLRLEKFFPARYPTGCHEYVFRLPEGLLHITSPTAIIKGAGRMPDADGRT